LRMDMLKEWLRDKGVADTKVMPDLTGHMTFIEHSHPQVLAEALRGFPFAIRVYANSDSVHVAWVEEDDSDALIHLNASKENFLSDARAVLPYTPDREYALDLVAREIVVTRGSADDGIADFIILPKAGSMCLWAGEPLAELWAVGAIEVNIGADYAIGDLLTVEITRAGRFMIDMWKDEK
jgi:hypothetical protein